mmetsp:Transcript_13714/g.23542  ORF Transcript_13714/g.23542 Transcript_13714/m.23542 type:complete len:165 (-) Transcript_13714:37-531(-)
MSTEEQQPITEASQAVDGDHVDETPALPEDVRKQALVLNELMLARKAFRKEQDAVYKKNRQYIRDIKTAKDALSVIMRDNGLEKIVLDGFEFEIKSRTVPKHDMTALRQVLAESGSNEDSVETYITQVSSSKADVVMRRAKRARVEAAGEESEAEEEEMISADE